MKKFRDFYVAAVTVTAILLLFLFFMGTIFLIDLANKFEEGSF